MPIEVPGIATAPSGRASYVLEEVTAWQARPLEPMYPVVFFDALRVKIRDGAALDAFERG